MFESIVQQVLSKLQRQQAQARQAKQQRQKQDQSESYAQVMAYSEGQVINPDHR